MESPTIDITDVSPGTGTSADDPPRRVGRRAMSGAAATFVFILTFLAAWLALDRLVTSPPLIASSLLALGVSGAVLLGSERFVTGLPIGGLLRRLGLGRPALRALVVALVSGLLVVLTFVGGAAVLGIHLELRSNWPQVLVGALLFHGVAEELVWRGYVYGHLRRRRSFARSILLSTPLIALTHAPIIVSNGIGVGSLAVASATITCLPFAYLYDRGGRSVWPPAVLHWLIGTWQLFERTYPTQFSMLILCGSIVTPLSAFVLGRRFLPTPITATPTPTITSPNQEGSR
jgi:membrane protease YdiL (CAAX protease family)